MGVAAGPKVAGHERMKHRMFRMFLAGKFPSQKRAEQRNRPPEDAGPSQSADYLPPAASGFTMRYREGGVDRVPLAVLFSGGRGKCE